MKNKLNKIKEDFYQAIEKINNEKELQDLELKFLSRKGLLSETLKELKDLSQESRKEIGMIANSIKKELIEKYDNVKKIIKEKETKKLIGDLSLPGKEFSQGHLNPITLIQNELEDIFTSLGFIVEDGPELESDYYNFTSLNVPPLHPARDMQDTFYVDKKNEKGENKLLLRTQTSSVQVRSLLKYGAPLKVVAPGRVFRNEATDARHEHTFYQFEGMMIGENINFANLKKLLEIVGKKLFGENTKLRMRPKFYPFVEPGNNGEYTCFLCQGKGCKVCKGSGWLEILGAGLVHPDVLRAGGIDPEKYSGLAFGFGLTRLAMLKYNINDVRLFNNGDIRFLEQF